jgi:hypothetical protein
MLNSTPLQTHDIILSEKAYHSGIHFISIKLLKLVFNTGFLPWIFSFILHGNTLSFSNWKKIDFKLNSEFKLKNNKISINLFTLIKFGT